MGPPKIILREVPCPYPPIPYPPFGRPPNPIPLYPPIPHSVFRAWIAQFVLFLLFSIVSFVSFSYATSRPNPKGKIPLGFDVNDFWVQSYRQLPLGFGEKSGSRALSSPLTPPACHCFSPPLPPKKISGLLAPGWVRVRSVASPSPPKSHSGLTSPTPPINFQLNSLS